MYRYEVLYKVKFNDGYGSRKEFQQTTILKGHVADRKLFKETLDKKYNSYYGDTEPQFVGVVILEVRRIAHKLVTPKPMSK